MRGILVKLLANGPTVCKKLSVDGLLGYFFCSQVDGSLCTLFYGLSKQVFKDPNGYSFSCGETIKNWCSNKSCQWEKSLFFGGCGLAENPSMVPKNRCHWHLNYLEKHCYSLHPVLSVYLGAEQWQIRLRPLMTGFEPTFYRTTAVPVLNSCTAFRGIHKAGCILKNPSRLVQSACRLSYNCRP